MRRDPTEFRLRFLRWKNGELVYKDGLPHYEDGKDSYPILGGKVIEDVLKEQYRYNNDIEYRFKIKDRNLPEASEIKIPFINNKRIVLTNAGLSTGAVISENMLDTIAKYAKAAGIPIKTALGIAAKESTLGNPTDDRSVYKILNKESAAYFKKMGTAQHINVGDLVNGRELVNFYVDTDPVYYAAKLYAKKHSINNEDYLNKLKGGEKYADLQASQRERFRNKNVIQAAFEYYRDFPHKYNPGQKNYQQLVNKRGDELMSSPEVLNWYKQLPHYEGGKDSDLVQLSTALNNFGYRLLSFLPYTRVLTNVFDIAGISPDALLNTVEDLTDGSGLAANVLQNKKYAPINNGTLARLIADAKNQAWKKALRPLKAIDILGDVSLLYKDYKILNNAAKKTHGVYKSGITIDPYDYH